MFVNLIITLAISLLIAGLFCIGWWESTRGTTEISPNGKDAHIDDMIFYNVNLFLNQKTTNKVYYVGKFQQEVINKLCKIETHFRYIISVSKIHEGWIDIQREDIAYFTDDYIEAIFKNYKYNLEIDREHGFIRFYKEYDNYKFSKYLRKPIVGCYKCFASFWGIPLWSLVYFISQKYSFITFNLFEYISLLVVHTFCLVTINIYIKKKIG